MAIPSPDRPPDRTPARPLRVNEDRIVCASIIALALGVIPIVVLSDRLSPRCIHHARLVLCCAML